MKENETADNSARLAWMENLPEEALAQVWSRRAAQLARVVEEQEQGEQVELAMVRLGREIYGLDVQYLFEIRPLDHLTRVPRVPDWIAGVVNLRGRIVSALDLSRFLGLTNPEKLTSGEPARSHLVVVEIPEMELGLLVDEVLSIETIPAGQIQEASTAIRGIQADYVRGMLVSPESHTFQKAETASGTNGDQGEMNHALIVVLDLPRLLSDKRLIIHEEIL